MSTLNKYPQLFDHTLDNKSKSVLDELKEEYVDNLEISAPEIFFEKLDGIQSMMNYFITVESCLSFQNTDVEGNFSFFFSP